MSEEKGANVIATSAASAAGAFRVERSGMPSIHDLYRLAKDVQERPPVTLTEEELKTAKATKSQTSIFANEAMLKKFEALPEDVKERFRNSGSDYYSRVIDTVNGSVERAAAQYLCEVRSGVSPRDLSKDELMVLRTIYGKEWYTLVGLESEEDD